MKQAEIQRLLPEIFQRAVSPGNPLAGVLAVMELLQTPSEEVLQHLETYFDPQRTPPAFVAYLAGWVDLDQLLSVSPARGAPDSPPVFPTGVGRLRELVAAAPYLSKWRGTARGLLTFLEIATGQKGFMIEEQPPDQAGLPRPFHLRIQAPAMSLASQALVEAIIKIEKPAYVTFEISYAQ
jgi:phage tail-like protein